MVSGRNATMLVLVSVLGLFAALIEAQATCGGDLIMESGVLHSPNYPSPYPALSNCKWRITIPDNNKVFFKFKSLATESHIYCAWDSVEIYDGHEGNSPSLGRFCGSMPGAGVLSSSNKITVHFASDGANQGGGFEAYFRKEPCGGDIIRDKGSLESPYYPRPQPFAADCTWKITVPENYMVALKFRSFQIGSSDDCTDNYLEIRDGHETKSRLLGHYCGTQIPENILSSDNKLTIKFVSNTENKFLLDFEKDIQAMATMAMACLASRPNLNVDEAELDRMAADLKSKQHPNGTVDNLASTALVMQALLATDSFLNFDFNGSMNFINQKIKNDSLSMIESFYIIPVLSGKSLLNITSAHCPPIEKTDLDILKGLRSSQDDRIQVQYSVYVGNELDFIRCWKIKVPSNYSFYNVLEKMASLEPEYRVQYSVHAGKPYVSGLTKIVDHAEKGMYWFVYKQTLGSSEEPILVEKSPVDIRVNKNEELILWYRSGSWDSK